MMSILMVMMKSSKQVLSLWDSTRIDSLNIVTGLLQIMIQNLQILMPFPTGEVWVSHDLLVKAMELLSNYHGLTTCIKKVTVMCNRKGENKTSRACVNGAVKAGCTFYFKLASMETEKYLPPNSTVKKSGGTKRGGTGLHRLSLGVLSMESCAHQTDQIESQHVNNKGNMSTTFHPLLSLVYAIPSRILVGMTQI
jgi:hypothetical protein